MCIRKYCIALILSVLGIGVSYSQESRSKICIDFRVNSTVIDSAYSDNAARMSEMISFLRDIRQDSLVSIQEVSFCGAASPEGSYQLNRKLAKGRLTALEKLIRREVEIPDSLVTRNDSYIPWEYLKAEIKDSDLPHKAEVLSILNEDSSLVKHNGNHHVDNRIPKLKKLDGGKVWKEMNRRYFSSMRNACTVFVIYKKEVPVVVEPAPKPEPAPIVEPEPVVEPEPAIEPEPVVVEEPAPAPVIVPAPEAWTRQLHVKTNAVGLAMAVANVAVEVDICKHLSFTLPVYYSAWDYFKSTLKFRTFSIQPEFRYWFKPENDGWFVGAHFGAGFYNFALDGAWRYQDYRRETPSMGGGISAGYRKYLSKNKRWKMEFALGGGVYDSHYDKFHNEPNGRLYGDYQKTFIGVDNVSVAIAYAFNLKKKGGKP